MQLQGMEAALASIAPSDVATGVRAISADDMAGLDATELAVVAKAVEHRRHEFATGRALLRQLMASRLPIAASRSRAPVLPSGWVGSLAHDRAVAVAAVSQSPSVAALGIDVEPDEPLAAGIARMVLRPDERRLDAHLAFTLKEAAYKAWSSTGGEILDHHDVRLELNGRRFRAVVIAAQRPIDGIFTTVSGRHLALAVVRWRDGRPESLVAIGGATDVAIVPTQARPFRSDKAYNCLGSVSPPLRGLAALDVDEAEVWDGG